MLQENCLSTYSVVYLHFMLPEIEGYLAQFNKDSDPAKAALSRVMVEAIRGWVQIYGDIPNPSVLGWTELEDAQGQFEVEAVIRIKKVEPLPKELDRLNRPNNFLARVSRSGRDEWIGPDGERGSMVDLGTVKFTTLAELGYNIIFYEDTGGLGEYATPRSDMAGAAAGDKSTFDKINSLIGLARSHPILGKLNHFVDKKPYSLLLEEYQRGLIGLLEQHPYLKP